MKQSSDQEWSPKERIREYFTLRRQRQQSARLSEDARAAVLDSLRLGEQQIEAGEILWTHGHEAEGLQLTVKGFRTLSKGTGELNHASAPELTREASSIADSLALPQLDAETEAHHERAYRLVNRAGREIAVTLRRTTMSAVQLRGVAISRWIGFGVGVGLVLLAGWWWMRTPYVETAIASARLGTDGVYAEDKVIDGDERTRWLLPNRNPGWVEVRLSPPRRIRAVRLLNTSNPPWHDRAAKEFRLELYDRRGKVAHSSEGVFKRLDRRPQWHKVRVSADQVSRIRVHVRSHHGLSGGLAELRWDS